MPLILIMVVVVVGLTTMTPAAAAAAAAGLGVMIGLQRWSEIESDHRDAGTPWQYRPTLWVILFLLFVGVLVGAKLF